MKWRRRFISTTTRSCGEYWYWRGFLGTGQRRELAAVQPQPAQVRRPRQEIGFIVRRARTSPTRQDDVRLGKAC
jgi:hypothetical protein